MLGLLSFHRFCFGDMACFQARHPYYGHRPPGSVSRLEVSDSAGGIVRALPTYMRRYSVGICASCRQTWCFRYVMHMVGYSTAPPQRVGDPVGLTRLNGRLPLVARIGMRAGAMREQPALAQ